MTEKITALIELGICLGSVGVCFFLSCSGANVPSWLRDPQGPQICQDRDGEECFHGHLYPEAKRKFPDTIDATFPIVIGEGDNDLDISLDITDASFENSGSFVHEWRAFCPSNGCTFCYGNGCSPCLDSGSK